MAFVKTSVSLPDKQMARLEAERGATPLSTHIQHCLAAYWDTVDRGAEAVRSKFSREEIEGLLGLMNYLVVRYDAAKIPPASKGMKSLVLDIRGAETYEDAIDGKFLDAFPVNLKALQEKVEGLTLAEASFLWAKLVQFWLQPQFKDHDGEEPFAEVREILTNNQEEINATFGIKEEAAVVPF